MGVVVGPNIVARITQERRYFELKDLKKVLWRDTPPEQLQRIIEWCEADMMEAELKPENLPDDRSMENIIRKLPMRRMKYKMDSEFFVADTNKIMLPMTESAVPLHDFKTICHLVHGSIAQNEKRTAS